MILSRIAFLADERGFYAPELLKGLRYLEKTDFARAEPGRHEIAGDDLFALVSEYVPEPKAKRRPEAHKKYIDIQYVVSGEEAIGYAPLPHGAKPAEDLLTEKDIAFFADPAGETDLVLSAGAFAIFFPWDIHRPGCAIGKGTPVRKVVVKVRMP